MMKKKISSVQKMLNTWAIALIMWAVYRTYFETNLPIWFDEFFAKPMIFLIPVYHYISTYEHTNFWEGVDLHKNNLKKNIFFGLSIGAIFLLTGFIVQFLKKGDINFLTTTSIIQVVYYCFISFASSFSEEILSRGFVLKRLYEDSQSIIGSVFFASFLFFFLHIPILFTNPDLYGNTLIQVMVTDLLLSFAVSFLYLQRKSVIVPILIHAFYNLSLYLLVS